MAIVRLVPLRLHIARSSCMVLYSPAVRHGKLCVAARTHRPGTTSLGACDVSLCYNWAVCCIKASFCNPPRLGRKLHGVRACASVRKVPHQG